MEELRPEDIEDLLQELEEESGAQESLPQEVEDLLRVLKSGNLHSARQDAAEQLGNVGTSSDRIVRALIAASESDLHPNVRRAAAKSLRASAHQEYLQRELGLAIQARVAEVMASLPPGNLRYWLLASLYAPILIGVTYLAFAVEGNWRFWVTGVVWFIGGGLGLYVLNKKGHGALIEEHSPKLEGPDGWGLFVLAVVGPFLLLAALLARTREPGYDVEVKPEEQQQRPDLAEATEEALQKIPSSDTVSERLSLEAALTDERSGDGLSWLYSALLALFMALSASVFLITIDQLFIVLSDAPGSISLIYLLGLVLVSGVTGACYAYCAPGKTTSSAATIRALLGGVAGVVYAVINLIRGRIMLSLPGYGWTSGDLQYFFAISLGGNALFGAIAGAIGGAFVAFARGQSTAHRTTRVGRWPLVGGLLLWGISVCIWVVILATTTK
jgi:hypothetical protein